MTADAGTSTLRRVGPVTQLARIMSAEWTKIRSVRSTVWCLALTLLLTIAAGLGVLNTVVLNTRERVHDLGVFKVIGMTPRQTTAMAVCWVAGIGLIAGLVAVPVGIVLHRTIGDRVAAGESLCAIRYNSASRATQAKRLIEQSYQISETPPAQTLLVRKIISSPTT